MIYGRIATECGYTFPQIRAMTFHDAQRLFRYWSRFPQALGRYQSVVPPSQTGGTASSSDAAVISTPEEMEAFMKQTGGRLDRMI